MNKTFKVWDYKENDWVRNHFEECVEFNYWLPGEPEEGKCFVDVCCNDYEIVWPDENGEFQIP